MTKSGSSSNREGIFLQYRDVINFLTAVAWHDRIMIKNKKRICLILISIYQNLSRGHLMYANVAGINHLAILKEIFKILKSPQLLKKF